MSLDDRVAQLAVLDRANKRALSQTLNVPLSRRLSGARYGGARHMENEVIEEEIQGGMMFERMMKPRGRPRKQTQKDKEDERLAMEIKELKDHEGGSMDLKFGSGVRLRKDQARQMARRLGEEYGRGISRMDKEANELLGGGFWSDFAGGLKKGLSIAKDVAKIIPHPAAQVAGLAGDMLGLGRSDMLGMTDRRANMSGGAMLGMTDRRANMSGGAMLSMTDRRKIGGRRAKAGAGDKRKARGALISKLMRENGMSLGEASKHIKQNNLM